MATATTPAPKWTESEKRLGDQLRAEAQNYSGPFLQKWSTVAKKFGYASYAHLPQGTKSYISSLGGSKRKRRT